MIKCNLLQTKTNTVISRVWAYGCAHYPKRSLIPLAYCTFRSAIDHSSEAHFKFWRHQLGGFSLLYSTLPVFRWYSLVVTLAASLTLLGRSRRLLLLCLFSSALERRCIDWFKMHHSCWTCEPSEPSWEHLPWQCVPSRDPPAFEEKLPLRRWSWYTYRNLR